MSDPSPHAVAKTSEEDVDVFVSPRRFGGTTPSAAKTRERALHESKASKPCPTARDENAKGTQRTCVIASDASNRLLRDLEKGLESIVTTVFCGPFSLSWCLHAGVDIKLTSQREVFAFRRMSLYLSRLPYCMFS
jgi:hypothetical protein